MVLKKLVAKKLMEEVISQKSHVKKGTTPPPPPPTENKEKKHIDFRVLVVDKPSLRMLSACKTIHEISLEGITLVEDILQKREALTYMDALYLITPTQENVDKFIDDWENPLRPQYRYAHVFFTESCPTDLFEQLHSRLEINRFMKTCKEINMSFVPFEEQVFSLDLPNSLQRLYAPAYTKYRAKEIERIAEQVATVCCTLGEYPIVRYRSEWVPNLDLAVAVQEKLNAYKADEPTMGQGAEKASSQLLIIDRGFDCASPVLHELTYQAMVYDLLPIEKDVYRYYLNPYENQKEVLLDEKDELWVDLRHKHIADVTKKITELLKNFTDSKKLKPTGNMDELAQIIKNMPQHQEEITKYSKHLQLAEDCMAAYQKNIERLCHTEQDLATGIDVNGLKIRDLLRTIVPILLDARVPNEDKVRIIILYMSVRRGTSEEVLKNLFAHAQLTPRQQSMIRNLGHLGVFIDEDKKEDLTMRTMRNTDQKYQTSRWVPLIKDILQDTVAGKLDAKKYTFLPGRKHLPSQVLPTSSRYGQWHKDKSQLEVRKVPRLIVFIVGGLSMSEMRCAYEVRNDTKDWEIIIGSTNILTPTKFMDDLAELSSKPETD